MSSSTDTFSTSSTSAVMQEEVASLHSLIPFGAGYSAPPPTPLASLPPSHPLPPTPLLSEPADDGAKISLSTSTHLASPPSKEDLDALAQYLTHQSLHSTPNLLSSPSLHRKRRTSMSAMRAFQPDNEEDVHVVNSRNDINVGPVMQTYSYAGGFCEESRRGIGMACQEVGAFNIAVQDAEEALTMLRGRHGAYDDSIFEGGLIPISQFLSSTSQHHQHDIPDLEPLALDSAVDTNFRDTMTRFATLLSTISKDLLRFLLEDLSIESQANIRGLSLKPLLNIHGNAKQELNLDDDVVLIISHDIDIRKRDGGSALFLARVGTQLQTWSQGKYKAPFSRSSCNKGSGEVSIQFTLIQHP